MLTPGWMTAFGGWKRFSEFCAKINNRGLDEYPERTRSVSARIQTICSKALAGLETRIRAAEISSEKIERNEKAEAPSCAAGLRIWISEETNFSWGCFRQEAAP